MKSVGLKKKLLRVNKKQLIFIVQVLKWMYVKRKFHQSIYIEANCVMANEKDGFKVRVIR